MTTLNGIDALHITSQNKVCDGPIVVLPMTSMWHSDTDTETWMCSECDITSDHFSDFQDLVDSLIAHGETYHAIKKD